MAGGTFEVNVSKKRPGDYINFKSKRQQSPNGSTRGTALIPLIGLGWGPDKGSIYDTNDFMLLIREAFKNAVTVIVYIINNGDKATKTAGGMTITAAYGGTRGNDIAVACVAEAGASTFAVRVYLGADKVEELPQSLI